MYIELKGRDFFIRRIYIYYRNFENFKYIPSSNWTITNRNNFKITLFEIKFPSERKKKSASDNFNLRKKFLHRLISLPFSNYPHAYLATLFSSNWVNFSRRTFYLYTRRVLSPPLPHIHVSTHTHLRCVVSNRYLYRCCTMMEADGGILFLSQWLITPRWRRIRDSRN